MASEDTQQAKPTVIVEIEPTHQTEDVEPLTEMVSKLYTSTGVSFDPEQTLDNYYLFKEFLDKEEMERIEKYVASIKLQPGTVGKGGSGYQVDKEYRTSMITWLPKDQRFQWLYDKIEEYVRIANDRMWKFSLSGMVESIQYGEYNPGGHYDWHLDVGGGSTSCRKVSVSIQMSSANEYEGGELQFFISRTPRIAPKDKGAMVLFPSFFLHKVNPVTKGKRKSLVIWFYGPPMQ